MKLEVKNLKIARFASEETLCYSATIYVNGKKAFHASNQGHGGCDSYHAIDKALMAEAEAWAASLPEETVTELGGHPCVPFTMKPCLETIIGDLIENIEVEKQIKKILKKFAFIKDGAIRTFNVPATDLAKRAVILKLNPSIQLLNDLPFEKAAEQMRAIV